MENDNRDRKIAKVTVKKLFGTFDYKIPVSGKLSHVGILYGDNGSGKTTILKMIYHLLASGLGIEHRVAIVNIPFKDFRVSLSDGTVVSVKRSAVEVDSPEVTFGISTKGEKAEAKFVRPEPVTYTYPASLQPFLFDAPMTWNISTASVRAGLLLGTNTDMDRFLALVDQLGVTLDYMSTDRQILNLLPRSERDNANKSRPTQGPDGKRDETLSSLRRRALGQSLERAEQFVKNRVLAAANVGTSDVNAIYADIATQIASADAQEATPRVSKDTLKGLIGKLVKLNEDYGRFEFTTPINMGELLKAIDKANATQHRLIGEIVRPYLQGLFARITALNDIYNLTSKFVDLVNHFFSHKSLEYKLLAGFVVVNDRGSRLSIDDLSSGEQQLLLLLSHILASRDRARIVIVDEPEISLNVKWQRDLIRSIGELAEGSDIQFIFATHSIEMIADHRSNVARLPATPND